MSNSGLNLYQDELLEILAEECAEVSQEKSKIFRFGVDEMSWHIKDKTHRECLEQEIGDLLAMVDLLVDSGMGITYSNINAAKERKLEKIPQWMKHKKPVPVQPGSMTDIMSKATRLAKQQLNNYKECKR